MGTIYHPEQQRAISIWQLLQIYAWHGKHHATQNSTAWSFTKIVGFSLIAIFSSLISNQYIFTPNYVFLIPKLF